MRTFLFAVVLFVVAGFGLAWWEDSNFREPGPSVLPTTVVVKPGSGLAMIAGQLEDNGVVDSALLFRAGVMRRGGTTDLKAGEYEFPAGATMADVLDMLIKHKTVEHKVTIPEGLTSDMAVAVINADPILQGPPVQAPEEGTLLPETYLFERGTTRAELLALMMKARDDLLKRLWTARQPNLPYKTPQDAVTMASLVEKETGVPAERGRVARVFLNRIKAGMKLESDPTIIYGLTKGVPLGHPIRMSELNKPNPYSTYQIVGLPPGPICNPGRRSIEAALNPPPGDDMFFVANGTGGHSFAVTLAEHEKNVTYWRQLQANRAASVPPQAQTQAQPAPQIRVPH